MAEILRLATSRERPAVKSCPTCAYFRTEMDGCAYYGQEVGTPFMRGHEEIAHCGSEGRFWEPRPPRRSLARWIYETFLKLGDAR